MKHASRVYMVLAFILLYFPIAVMIVYSFNGSDSTAVLADFPSLKWYRELFSDSETLGALGNSLIIAVCAALISTLIGTAAAVGICRMRNKRMKAALQTVTNIPMMNPEIVTAISMMLLFVFVGTLVSAVDKLNFWTLLIAHITFCLPYVILSVIPKVQQLDRFLPEAAQDLGCTPVRAFFKVELPAILPGVFSGMVMALTLSLDDFVISYFTAGSGFETLPIRIFSMTKKRVKPDMYALSTLIFLLILALLLISNFAKRDETKVRKASVSRAKRDRKIKVVSAIVLGAVLLGGISFKVISYDPDALVLNVYNWGEYISDGSEDSLDVIAEFEDWYFQTYHRKVTVNYSTYASNEDLYAKLKSGASGYDVIFPSEYMMERMMQEDMLAKLDYTLIPNAKDVDERYDLAYAHDYATPYTVGTVGLIYNTKMVKEAPTSWSAMWDPAYAGKVLTFNNPRDAFMIALFKLSGNETDLNTTDEAKWQAAYQALREQKKIIQSYVMDEIFNKMENGEAAMAPYYAGDYLTMASNNPDLAFVYPEEGTNFFIDYMCIPKTSTRQELANVFINFMQSPEIARANAEYISYASPLTTVANDPEYAYSEENDPDSYAVLYGMPDGYYMDIFHNLPDETQSLMNRLWDSLKIESSGGDTGIYIATAVIFAVMIGFGVFWKVCRYRREKRY